MALLATSILAPPLARAQPVTGLYGAAGAGAYFMPRETFGASYTQSA